MLLTGFNPSSNIDSVAPYFADYGRDGRWHPSVPLGPDGTQQARTSRSDGPA